MDKGSGMTVGEFIADLQEYPPDAPVGICIGPASDLRVLSIYRTESGTEGSRVDGKETVWIDLGEQDE